MDEYSPEPIRSPLAREDLTQIEDDVAVRRGNNAAQKVLSTILEKACLHARFPGIGRSRDDLSPGLRSFVVLPYVIFFRPVNNTIELVRILHGRRDVDSIIHETLGKAGNGDAEDD